MHVVGPEQGLTLPGLLIVCGDSHTSTHGAFGAYAFGIGASEVAHVLMTQTLWQKKPQAHAHRRSTARPLPASRAKDIALAIIARIGADGAQGHAIEFAGTRHPRAVDGRPHDLCNMSIEAGGRCGMVAPDATTFAYLEGPPLCAPRATLSSSAREAWSNSIPMQTRHSTAKCTLDAGRDRADRDLGHDAGRRLADRCARARSGTRAPIRTRAQYLRDALDYMGITPGKKLTDIAVDRVFIGSCTNARIEDLRAAAAVLAGRVSKVPGLVSPGSSMVKRQAEEEGLDQHVPRRRPGMGGFRLLDVRRHQWRHRAVGRTLRLDHQPQFSRPPGPGRAHPSDVAGHGRRRRSDRPSRRRAAAAAGRKV